MWIFWKTISAFFWTHLRLFESHSEYEVGAQCYKYTGCPTRIIFPSLQPGPWKTNNSWSKFQLSKISKTEHSHTTLKNLWKVKMYAISVINIDYAEFLNHTYICIKSHDLQSWNWNIFGSLLFTLHSLEYCNS